MPSCFVFAAANEPLIRIGSLALLHLGQFELAEDEGLVSDGVPERNARGPRPPDQSDSRHPLPGDRELNH